MIKEFVTETGARLEYDALPKKTRARIVKDRNTYWLETGKDIKSVIRPNSAVIESK